jgi:hypothetical protein
MNTIKTALAAVLTDVMNNHESGFEKTQDYYGIESAETNSHIYNMAHDLWCEFELDLTEYIERG